MTNTTELRRHRVCESDLNYSCPQAGLENTYDYMRGKPCNCHVRYATALLDALDKAEQRIRAYAAVAEIARREASFVGEQDLEDALAALDAFRESEKAQ